MASILSTATSGRTQEPPRILLYGLEGIGKSTFAAHAPKPIFIQTEDGLGQIECTRLPLCNTLDDVFTYLRAIRDDEHDFQTCVIDSLDWLERLIWARVCADYGVKSIERADGGYGKGYVHALGYWTQIKDILCEIRAKRHMAIILVAHYKVENIVDPEIGQSIRNSPQIHKLASALWGQWCDAVFFADRRKTKDAETGKVVAIGADGGERMMYTNGAPGRVAKNRYSLPTELPLSWDAFVAAMK